MNLVLDTSAYTLFALGIEDAVSAMEAADSLTMPAIVYGELWHGFLSGHAVARIRHGSITSWNGSTSRSWM